MKNIIVSKDSYSEFNCWKETESIDVDSENEDYKLLTAFQAGYDSGSAYTTRKVAEASKSKIDTSTTINDKLLSILFTHYGLREFYVDTYCKMSYKVTLHIDVQTPFDNFTSFLSADCQPYVKSADPWVTRLEIICYTPDVTKTLLEVITKLTK